MRDNALSSFNRLKQSFNGFTVGQKVVSIVGAAAVLVAAFMVFQMTSKPSMSVLYSGLSGEDASAVVEQLNADGITYELTNGGSTVMVASDVVNDARINLSGQGIPSGSDGGYSILDDQGLSTSEFQQQTDFKRAMEGELASTIEAIDGVNTAVVALAIPEKVVFTEQQQPTTASVLVDTTSTLDPGQVQAIVNLVSSSVDGLDEKNVSVTDAAGTVLHSPGTSAAGSTQAQDQKVVDFQARMTSQVQTMLDRVVGPGNSTVTVTPVLNFDESTQETVRYFGQPIPLSSATNEETYTGAEGDDNRGILGPDGQMEIDAANNNGGDYTANSETVDNGVNKTTEVRQAAPGSVDTLHVGVLLDTASLANNDPNVIRDSVAASLGIDEERGDTIEVTAMEFDRSVEEANAAALAEAAKDDVAAARNRLIRNGGIALAVLVLLGLAYAKARKRRAMYADSGDYLNEQLRLEASQREVPAAVAVEQIPAAAPAPAAVAPAAQALALEAQDTAQTLRAKELIGDMTDAKPDEVADLLRGWLVR